MAFAGSLLVATGCGDGVAPGGQREIEDSAVVANRSNRPLPGSPAELVADARPAIIAFGDSLTSGYGIEVDEAWPARLQELLDEREIGLRVVNAGLSGETTAGGLRRLPWVLEREPNALLIVIALGGNDGLRGSPPWAMAENLERMIEAAEVRELEVLLAGVPAPPQLGADYAEEFGAVFRRVSDAAQVRLLESLLAGVAGVPELNQRDGIHPNADGARRLADNVFDALAPALADVSETGRPILTADPTTGGSPRVSP